MRTIFNFLGPLTNPAGATRQVIGVSDARFLDVMAGALARLGARKAMVVSSADGLDELSTSGADPRRRGRRRRAAHLRGRRPRPSGCRARPTRTWRAARPRSTPPPTRRIFAGEPGPPRDLAVLNAGAAIYVAGRAPTRWRRACAPPRPRWTTAARPGRSTRSCGSRVSWRRRERAGSHRGGDARGGPPPPRRRPPRRARGRAARPAGQPPVPGGAHPPGHLADRRAQAPLAVGRRDPRGRRPGRDRPGLRARRRGGAVHPHRAVPLRRLARRPARRARRDPPARPAQGLHRRPLPALRVGGRRRRRHPADRRRPGARASSPSCTARRGRSTSTSWSRSTTRRSSRPRWRSTPT